MNLLKFWKVDQETGACQRPNLADLDLCMICKILPEAERKISCAD